MNRPGKLSRVGLCLLRGQADIQGPQCWANPHLLSHCGHDTGAGVRVSDRAPGVLTADGEEVRRIKTQQGFWMIKKRSEDPLRRLTP